MKVKRAISILAFISNSETRLYLRCNTAEGYLNLSTLPPIVVVRCNRSLLIIACCGESYRHSNSIFFSPDENNVAELASLHHFIHLDCQWFVKLYWPYVYLLAKQEFYAIDERIFNFMTWTALDDIMRIRGESVTISVSSFWYK